MTTEVLEREKTVEVKVVMMGKSATTFVRPEPLALGDLLKQIGVNGKSEVRVNGVGVEEGHRLTTGDTILVVPKIRGG